MQTITEINIIPVKPDKGLVAFVTCVIDNALYLSGMTIYTKIDGSGHRLGYPAKKKGDKNFNIYHPINKETTNFLEDNIIAKYKELNDN